MSEKRILCTEVDEMCQYLVTIESQLQADAFECQQDFYCSKSTAWKPITKTVCKNCKYAKYEGITREQAIYKMAKSICNWYYTECNECAIKDKPKECKAFLKDSDFYERAEEALNAVLECKTMESKIK